MEADLTKEVSKGTLEILGNTTAECTVCGWRYENRDFAKNAGLAHSKQTGHMVKILTETLYWIPKD